MKLGKKSENNSTRIGIAIPCYFKDKHLLPLCLQAISRLDPPPHTYSVDVNRGEGGLKRIRTRLFDKLFETCDVVLQCDVDFYLFPDILYYVHPDKLISFNRLTRSISDVSRLMARFISRQPWTGCYSLPKNIWRKVKESSDWDGTDGAVQKIVGRYTFVYTPKYYLLRRSTRRLKVALSHESWLKKVRNLFLRGI